MLQLWLVNQLLLGAIKLHQMFSRCQPMVALMGQASDRLMASHQWKGLSRIRFVQNDSPDGEAKPKTKPAKKSKYSVVLWFTCCFWYYYCYTCIYITIYIGVWSCEVVSFEMLLSLQSGCSTPTWGDRHDTHIIIYVYTLDLDNLIYICHIYVHSAKTFTIRVSQSNVKSTSEWSNDETSNSKAIAAQSPK